ncbi:MAG: ATP-binding cassette domain-containing protein [Firmicutes bacterium]|nr:ATP-binding cassette domain-containing protein [Bacillota bacterium]MCL1953897.1 ATP-binding cassette domain-containing protein [Bacillota bacterium]
MILLDKICKSYGDNQVLTDLSISFEKGNTCIMGQSGKGKTTILSLIVGLQKPDSGTIVLPNNATIGCVFQEDRLVESMTVIKNMLLVGKNSEIKFAKSLLTQLGLDNITKYKVNTLSGGMKRRIAIARALFAKPEILILDEPFDGLDMTTKLQTIETIKNQTIDKICIFVSHDPNDVKLLNAKVINI